MAFIKDISQRLWIMTGLSTVYVVVYIIVCIIPLTSAQRIAVKYNVTEDKPVDYTIGNIPGDTHLHDHFSPEVFPTITYKFLENSPFLDYLDLDDKLGDLRIRRMLDRETICPQLGVTAIYCDISLYVATEPATHRTIIKVTISVYDTNDNMPRFKQRSVTLDVSENAAPTITKFTLPQATDPDYGLNSIQGYRLEPLKDEFHLEITDNPVGPADLRLILMRRLDRETVDHYKMTVVSWDGGRPQLTGTLTININVLDSNDNAPEFTKATYQVEVRENQAVGSTLLYVQAEDSDHSANGEVIYKFSPSSQAAHGKLFDINQDTGEIYTIGELDYEQGSIYSLSVIASDRGPNSFQAFAKVVITITDMNDNAPEISVSGLGQAGRVEVVENSDIPTLVALIDVHDPEDGINSKVTCSMTSKSFMLQEIATNQYEIVTAAAFNRETQAEYQITLLCQDHWFPAQVASRVITIYIVDVNDNTPVFQHTQYNASLYENSHPGEFLVRVIAADMDKGKHTQYNVSLYENSHPGEFLVRVIAADIDKGHNAKLTYSIQRLMDDSVTLRSSYKLAIDAKNGTVFTTGQYDREVNAHYRYIITAIDNGSPHQLSSTTILNVNIFDINDETPQFTVHQFKFGSYENQPTGTEIGTITATDRDLSPNNRIQYSLKSSTQDSNAFQIDSKSGKITTKKMLDREVIGEYNLVVLASNPDEPKLKSKANVTVYIADRNDNAPFFNFPQPHNKTVNITGDIHTGDTVAHISAQDADSGKNAALTYAISAGNDDAYFDVNILGEIFIARPIDLPGGYTTFNLDITVSDKGDPPLYSTQTLQILLSFPVVPPSSTVHNTLVSLSANTNILIVVLCSVLVVIIFTVILLFGLLVVRRKKHPVTRHHPLERRNSNGCMEATKALLTIGGTPQQNSDQPPDGNGAPPSYPPEHDSMDSGVDMPPPSDSDHRQGNPHMMSWGKSRQAGAGHNQSACEPQSPQVHSSLLSTPDTLLTDDDSSDPRALCAHQKPYIGKGPTQMTEIQLRVHEMLYNLNSLSHDTDCSNSDSGKGPSEEDDSHTVHTDEVELQALKYPPTYSKSPFRESPWERQQPYQQVPSDSYNHNTDHISDLYNHSDPYNTAPPSNYKQINFTENPNFQKKTQACKPILKPPHHQGRPGQYKDRGHYMDTHHNPGIISPLGKDMRPQIMYSSNSAEQLNKPYNGPALEGNNPHYSTLNSGGKKKTVHFVKPYSCGQDFTSDASSSPLASPNNATNSPLSSSQQLCSPSGGNNNNHKPTYIFCPSPKPLHSKTHSGKNHESQNSLPDVTRRTMTSFERPANQKYFDIWGRGGGGNMEDMDDSVCSNGGTTTSGSYCMDTTQEKKTCANINNSNSDTPSVDNTKHCRTGGIIDKSNSSSNGTMFKNGLQRDVYV